MPSHTAIDVSDVIVMQFTQDSGIPRQILSDQGPELMIDVFTNLCKLLGIDKIHMSLYSPATNSATECQNKVIQQMLTIYIENRPLDWDKNLPLVNVAHSRTTSSSTGLPRINYYSDANSTLSSMYNYHVHLHKCQPPIVHYYTYNGYNPPCILVSNLHEKI